MQKTLIAASLLALAAGAQAQSATYAIDPTHTFVTFEIDHMGTSTNRGRFNKKEGTVQFDRKAKAGKVELTIDTTSIDTGVEPFNKHLRSKDFFDTDTHGTAKFVADKFSFSGDKISEVAGTLTLLGKTKPVTLKASKFNCYDSPIVKREVCGGDFETVIQRSQWGMSFGSNFGVADNVKLVVQVEAIKQ